MSNFVTLLDTPGAAEERPERAEERHAPVDLRTFGDLQALVDAFDVELAPPIRHDVAETDIAIVQVGVTLRLPADVHLVWARLTATLWPDDTAPTVVDVLPTIVLDRESAAGPLEIGDDGHIRRAPVAGDPAIGFAPYVSGYRAGPRVAS